jgi:hypothetical protein
MVKALLFITLLLTSCVSLRTPSHIEDVTLHRFPNVQTDYTYHIKLAPDVKEVAIFWYYLSETRNNMIYRSGVVPIRYGNLETQMYFPWEGQYILVILTQTHDRSKHQTHKFRYNVGFRL